MKLKGTVRILTAGIALLICLGACAPQSEEGQPTESEQISEQLSTEEITTEAPETTEEEIKMPNTIRIGSYNIKHAADAKLNLKTIAKVITDNNLDIVGIQEVDLRTKRSNGIFNNVYSYLFRYCSIT